MNAVSVTTQGYEAAGELLRALAAPARLAIVVRLAERPCYVHELVDQLEMSQPLVSPVSYTHLDVYKRQR